MEAKIFQDNQVNQKKELENLKKLQKIQDQIEISKKIEDFHKTEEEKKLNPIEFYNLGLQSIFLSAQCLDLFLIGFILAIERDA